jgi:TatD DNase family protein
MKTTPQNTDYIDIHSHNSESQPGIFRVYNLFLQDYHPDITHKVFSCGLHPWHIQHYEDIDHFPEKLEKVIDHPGMIAIGEAGLDKIIPVEMDQQIEIFKIQVELSEKYKLPVIIHCVKAFQELLQVRQETSAEQTWILHGFNSSAQMAGDLVEKGIFISGGLRLLRSKSRCQEVLKSIPLEFLFIETDDDEDTHIREVYSEIASCLEIEVDELQMKILENFKKVFIRS